jgi:hypothetical protein
LVATAGSSLKKARCPVSGAGLHSPAGLPHAVDPIDGKQLEELEVVIPRDAANAETVREIRIMRIGLLLLLMWWTTPAPGIEVP